VTELTFPEGTTVYSGLTALVGDGLTIRGEGSHRTTVILPAGFDITFSNAKTPPRIEGVTLLTQGAGCGTALKITGPVLASSVTRGLAIEDVTISGENWSDDWWTNGIHFVDCWYPTVSAVCIRGRNQTQPPFAMATGIKFERTQTLEVEDLQIFWAQDGIAQVGSTFGEGLGLSNFEIVGVNRGVVLLRGGGNVIADGHINAYQTGIQLDGKTQISIHDNLIYKTHLSTANFVGINAAVGQQINVSNNIIDGGWQPAQQCSGSTYGMVLAIVSKGHFSGNLFTNFKTASAGIVVGFLSQNNTFVANHSDNAGTVVQVNPDAGPDNYLLGNRP
jgi:hypothetical protein